MDEEIKILVNKIAEGVCRKIKKVYVSDFHILGNNIGIGADGTVTKHIDKVAEDAALSIVKKSKLDINILSEEIGFIDNGSDYTCVLDPVDGTRNAYRGIPFFSVSVAVGKNSLCGVEYGVVKNLSTADVFSAERGFGAFLNNKKIGVPEIPDKEPLSSLSLGKNYDPVTIRLAKKDKVRSLGSASLEMCMVAIGGLDYYVIGKEYLRIIDIAASTLILREAGGVVTNILGENLDMGFSLDEHTSVVAAGSMDIVKEIIS